jgi:hypothetical protein
MQQQTSRGYVVWGHAIAHQEGLLSPDRFAASGTITRDNRFVDASGVLGIFDTEIEAQDVGIPWALAWVDNHS